MNQDFNLVKENETTECGLIIDNNKNEIEVFDFISDSFIMRSLFETAVRN